MGLYNRGGNLIGGSVVIQATEPSSWTNGSLWVDTDNGNLYVNISGTATQIYPITSAGITDLQIVNADVSASAAIASSKLATVAVAQGGTGLTALGTGLQLLRTNAGATAFEHAAPPSVAATRDSLGANETTTSSSYVDTGLAITLTNNNANGRFLAIASLLTLITGGAPSQLYRFVDNVTNIAGFSIAPPADERLAVPLVLTGTTSGQVIKIQKASNGTLTMTTYGGTDLTSHLEIMEVVP